MATIDVYMAAETDVSLSSPPTRIYSVGQNSESNSVFAIENILKTKKTKIVLEQDKSNEVNYYEKLIKIVFDISDSINIGDKNVSSNETYVLWTTVGGAAISNSHPKIPALDIVFTAYELDSAQSITQKSDQTAFQASEADVANSINRNKKKNTLLSDEIDSAQLIVPYKAQIPGGNAIDIRNTIGLETWGGAFWDEGWDTGTPSIARVIKDFPTFINDTNVWIRANYESSSNAWAATVKSEHLLPRNRVAVVWVSSGTASGTITISGQTTGPIAYNASISTIESALGALSSVGGVANVRVDGSLSNGIMITLEGSLTHTDKTFSVSGSGWNCRYFHVRPNYCINQQWWNYWNGTSQVSEKLPYPANYADATAKANIGYMANKYGGPTYQQYQNGPYKTRGELLWLNWEVGARYLFGDLGVVKAPVSSVTFTHEAVGTTWGYQNAAADATGWAQMWKNVWNYATPLANQNGQTIYWDYNLDIWSLRPNYSIWSGAYPGNSYVDWISIDTYPGSDAYGSGGTVARVAEFKSLLYNQLTPFAEARGKKIAVTEYATADGPLPGGFDNPNGYGEALYEWWQDMCDQGLATTMIYFDTGWQTREHALDDRPISRALYLNTFG